MNLLKIALGVLCLCMAWLVMYHSGLVLRFNAWMREKVFADRYVLFFGRRMAILLFILGGISLFSGLDQWKEGEIVRPNIASAMLEQARHEFKNHRYFFVVNRCKVLVRSNPKHLEAWELLAQSWWATGQKDKAKKAVEVILRLDPKNSIGKLLVDKPSKKTAPKPNRPRFHPE